MRKYKIHAAWICEALGILLIIVSVGLLLLGKYRAARQEEQRQEVAERLLEVIPKPVPGVALAGADEAADMAVFEIDGTGYIGILESAALDVCVPVAEKESATAPGRVSGNAQAQSLVICGGSEAFGGLSGLSVGDLLTMTDVTGHVWNYRVDRIEAAAEGTDAEGGLLLIIKQDKEKRILAVFASPSG